MATSYNDLIGATLYTKAGEIAIVTRTAFLRDDSEWQLYGVFGTGPLVDSTNAAGEPNEFLLTVSADELAHFGINA